MIILNVYIVCLVKKNILHLKVSFLYNEKFPDWLIFELQVLYAVLSKAQECPSVHQCLTSVFQFVYTLKL